jgi:hypothetical protein
MAATISARRLVPRSGRVQRAECLSNPSSKLARHTRREQHLPSPRDPIGGEQANSALANIHAPLDLASVGPQEP